MPEQPRPAPAPLVEVLRDAIRAYDSETHLELESYLTTDDRSLDALAARLAEAVERTWNFMEAQEAYRERDAARRELAKLKSTPEYEYANTVADERDAARRRYDALAAEVRRVIGTEYHADADAYYLRWKIGGGLVAHPAIAAALQAALDAAEKGDA